MPPILPPCLSIVPSVTTMPMAACLLCVSLLGLPAASRLSASESADAGSAAAVAAPDSEDAITRDGLAEASVDLGQIDDLVFTNLATQVVGFEAARREHRSAVLKQAFLALEPELHRMDVAAYRQLDLPELRSWVAFLATAEGARMLHDMVLTDHAINAVFSEHAGAWLQQVSDAVHQTPGTGVSAGASSGKPGKPGF